MFMRPAGVLDLRVVARYRRLMIEPFDDGEAVHHPEVADSAFVHRAAVLIGRVRIGDRSSVWPNATLRGDDGRIVVGACTSIQDGVVIHATEDLSETRVGDRCTVGHNAILHGAVVEDDCLVGMGAILLDNCRIGRGSLVGAGALVTQGTVVPPGSLVLGSPGKVVRAVRDQDADWIAYSWRHYVKRAEQFARQTRGGTR